MHTYLHLLYKDIKELIIKLVILVRPNFIFKGKNMMSLLLYVISSTLSTATSNVNILLSW